MRGEELPVFTPIKTKIFLAFRYAEGLQVSVWRGQKKQRNSQKNKGFDEILKEPFSEGDFMRNCEIRVRFFKSVQNSTN